MASIDAPASSTANLTSAALSSTNWQGAAGSSGLAVSASSPTSSWQCAGGSSIAADTIGLGPQTMPVSVDGAIVAVSACMSPTIFKEIVSSAIAAAGTASGYALIAVEVSNSMNIQSQAPAYAVYRVSVDSLISAMSGIQFVLDFTDGWAYNLNTGAASFYEQFKFNSFAQIDGEIYGANEQGIYRIGADNDAGANINATITLGTSTLESDTLKTVPAVYVGARGAEALVLTCRVEGFGEYQYRFTEGDAQAIGNCRAKPGKGLRGVYWQFELTNTNGGDFDIDRLSAIVAPTSRRV